MTSSQEVTKLKLVVLISGSGSNLQAIIDAIDSGELNAEVAAVISNVANVKGLERADSHNIPNRCLSHKDFDSREAFDVALQYAIDSYKPDLVILAGFMRILGADISRHYRGRMLNIHPSLLPKYPGLHTHQRALDAGDSKHGTSIHFVTEELDGGPLVYQKSFPITPTDTTDTLFAQVQQLEHQMYPEVIQWIAEKRLSYLDNQVLFDQEPVGRLGII